MFFNTLSGRFLALTVAFVIVAEVVVFVPSMARYRYDYLQGRLELAQVAALALISTPEDMVPPAMKTEILKTAGVLNIVLRRDQVREQLLDSPLPAPVSQTFYLEAATSMSLMGDAVKLLMRSDDRIIRVVGQTEQGARSRIEITLNEGPMRDAMIIVGRRIIYTSLVISLAMATLLFLGVRRLIVLPIRRVVEHMTAYRDNPEDASGFITPVSRMREVRQAETALQELQLRLTAALRQKERLAGLGAAVAKISHDLRNLLTTAQLMADRIEASADPGVRRIAPKLVGSLSRAISLCERTLAFGRAEELPPDPQVFALGPFVDDLLANERETVGGRCVDFVNAVPNGIAIRADADQLYRVLSNLVRNAAQAIEATGNKGRVMITARELEGVTEIRIVDTGPGLPQKARENLFQPFRGGVRQGGSGLGLVIAAELVKGHGGGLVLEETGPRGSTFRIRLPTTRTGNGSRTNADKVPAS